MDRRSLEQAIDVLVFAAVAAQQAVPAQQPPVARLRRRLVGWCGHVVGVGQACRVGRRQQAEQFLRGEASEGQVVIHLARSPIPLIHGETTMTSRKKNPAGAAKKGTKGKSAKAAKAT